MRVIKMSVLLLGMAIAGLPLHAGKLKNGKWMKVIDGGPRPQLKGKIVCIHGSIKEDVERLGEALVSRRPSVKKYMDGGYDLDGEIYYGTCIPVEYDDSMYCFQGSWLEEPSQEEIQCVKERLEPCWEVLEPIG